MFAGTPIDKEPISDHVFGGVDCIVDDVYLFERPEVPPSNQFRFHFLNKAVNPAEKMLTLGVVVF